MKTQKNNAVQVSKHAEERAKEIDAKRVWVQLEDQAVPQLGLPVIDHVVYFHLLRHSHLEGKRRLRFSIPWLARNIHLCVVSLNFDPYSSRKRRVMAQSCRDQKIQTDPLPK